jgi:hypothetical protein
MATAVTPERLTRSEPQLPLPTPTPAELPATSETLVCPVCAGTGWTKHFTPWGCPSSVPCSCTQPLVGSTRVS